MTFTFKYKKTDPHRSRLGTLTTPNGAIETPAFIFCATKASIKGVSPAQMIEAGTQIILSNTYHLFLQPGPDVVERAGGLHSFMGWKGPMLTDSGGFQIFSLGHGSVSSEIKGKRTTHRPKTLLKITEEGALFRSYTDGQKHLLTPEKSIEAQVKLGADLIVSFDECTPFHVEKDYTARSMRMSHRWGQRSLARFNELNEHGRQRLYGIIQGGVYEDLRRESTDFVNTHPFFGHAIGGSLGKDPAQMYDIVSFTAQHLDPARPIHLLGIGGIKDIFHGVSEGIDTFDCVHPTRLARHGGALVKVASQEVRGRDHVNLNNGKNRNDLRPIEENCPCATCKTVSRSYLHHLLKARELLAHTLISIHNIFFMNTLMKDIREGLRTETFEEVKKRYVA